MIRPFIITGLLLIALTAGCYQKATMHTIAGDKEIDPDSLNAGRKPSEQINPLTGTWIQEVKEGSKPWTLDLGGNNDFTARDGNGQTRITGSYQYANNGALVRFTSSGSSPLCPKSVGFYDLRYAPTRIEFQVRTDDCAERQNQWAFAWLKKE